MRTGSGIVYLPVSVCKFVAFITIYLAMQNNNTLSVVLVYPRRNSSREQVNGKEQPSRFPARNRLTSALKTVAENVFLMDVALPVGHEIDREYGRWLV